jgi:hypothetical protein
MSFIYLLFIVFLYVFLKLNSSSLSIGAFIFYSNPPMANFPYSHPYYSTVPTISSSPSSFYSSSTPPSPLPNPYPYDYSCYSYCNFYQQPNNTYTSLNHHHDGFPNSKSFFTTSLTSYNPNNYHEATHTTVTSPTPNWESQNFTNHQQHLNQHYSTPQPALPSFNYQQQPHSYSQPVATRPNAEIVQSSLNEILEFMKKIQNDLTESHLAIKKSFQEISEAIKSRGKKLHEKRVEEKVEKLKAEEEAHVKQPPQQLSRPPVSTPLPEFENGKYGYGKFSSLSPPVWLPSRPAPPSLPPNRVSAPPLASRPLSKPSDPSPNFLISQSHLRTLSCFSKSLLIRTFNKISLSLSSTVCGTL